MPPCPPAPIDTDQLAAANSSPPGDAAAIPFDPVPSRTGRRDGWTADRQRRFIAALARCGSVAAAARQVGRSVRDVYALRLRDGADSFCLAWDLAMEIGIDATRDCVIDRAMEGAWVPVIRRGRTVRMEYRSFDRLAIAVLSGRGREVDEVVAWRASMRAHRARLREDDRARAAARAEREAADAAYAAALAEMVERGDARLKAAAAPRVLVL